MALKLNKTIKTHIADMAIRSKYQAEFQKLMDSLIDNLFDVLYLKYNNDDFLNLPDRAKALIGKTSKVSLGVERIVMHKTKVNGKVSGYGLDVALETWGCIDTLRMKAPVFGSDCRFYINSDNEHLGAIKLLLDEASESRDILLAAMAPYKSANHMLNELHWANEFYPIEEEAKEEFLPSTISKANMIMGNNDEN